MSQTEALKRQATKIQSYCEATQPITKHISGLEINALPTVFPGGSDTQLLCDSIQIIPGQHILDVCTGAGAVALKAAQISNTSVYGTDINPAAVASAQANAIRLGLTNVTFETSDLWPSQSRQFDTITANPPYTDAAAPDLTARCFWDEGNQVVKRLFAELPQYLRLDGQLFMSWASFADQTLLPELAARYSYNLQQVNTSSSPNSGFGYQVYRITLRRS